jgi:peptidoglycan/LPS O-acetylase OafA/YrhL
MCGFTVWGRPEGLARQRWRAWRNGAILQPMVGQTLRGPGALRLMLALAVFAHHLSKVSIGGAAVYVFYALSGYWIFRMWEAKYSQAAGVYFTYITSRLWRLLPVFALFGVIFLALSAYRGVPVTPHSLFSSVFILGYSTLEPKPLVPAWSLDLELQFYLIAPLLIGLAKLWRPAVLLPIAALVSIAAALLSRGGLVTPYLVYFVCGICAARENWRPSARASLIALSLGGLATLALLLSPLRDVVLGGADPGPLHRFNALYNVGLAICVMPYALYTTGNVGGSQDGMFADLSYIVYLGHWGAAMWLSRYAAHLPGAERLGLTVAAVGVTLGGSWLVWKFYDKPINRLRARWVAGRIGRAATRNQPQTAFT